MMFSCKKNEKETDQAFWQRRKAEINKQVLNDLSKAKSGISQAISSNDDFVFIDQGKINSAFGYTNALSKKIDSIKIIKTFADKKEYDDKHFSKGGIFSSVPIKPQEPIDDAPVPPVMAIYDINVYRGRYYSYAQGYADLASFTLLINQLEDEVIANQHVNLQDKEHFLYETMMIKSYAADIENASDFWVDLVDASWPYPDDSTNVQSSNQSYTQKYGKLSYVQGALMGPYDGKGIGNRTLKRGCRLNTREILVGAVVGGFAGGYGGAVGGGTIGSFIPGAGTVAGGVSGAVLGFAGGFMGGALTTAIGQLITTCGR